MRWSNNGFTTNLVFQNLFPELALRDDIVTQAEDSPLARPLLQIFSKKTRQANKMSAEMGGPRRDDFFYNYRVI